MARENKVRGDLLDRCSLELRGTSICTGVLVSRSHVLTCAHAVEENETVSVHDGVTGERLTEATVVRRGNPDGSDDLALLILDDPLLGRGFVSFGLWKRSERFSVVGFLGDRKSQSSGVVLGESDFRGWLHLEDSGAEPIVEGFSGGAVWVEGQENAVGIVTHFAEHRVAYGIPVSQIRAFWPQVPKTRRLPRGRDHIRPEQSEPVRPLLPPNIAPARLVRVSASGDRLLGNGYRLDATRVLTTRDVLEPASGGGGLGVSDPASRVFRSRSADQAWPEEGADGPGELVVLETDPRRQISAGARLVEGSVSSGTDFTAVAYGEAATGPLDRIILRGRLGDVDVDRASVDLSGAPREEALDLFHGAAAFVENEPHDWRLLGLLQVVPSADGWAVSVALTEPLRNWPDFDRVFGPTNQHAQYARYRSDTARYLRNEQIRHQILQEDEDSHFGSARTPEEMAEVLCDRLDPDVLADALSSMYLRLSKAGSHPAADAVVQSLLASLPASVARVWAKDLPDASAENLVLAFSHRVLAEIVLAASEIGAIGFEDKPMSDSDTPRSRFHIRRFGELGTDPENTAGKQSLAKQIRNRLVLSGEGALSDEQSIRKAVAVIADVAVRKHDGEDFRLLDKDDLDLIDRAAGGENTAYSDEFLQAMRRELTHRAKSSRSFYYLVTAHEKDTVASVIREHLPEIKLIELSSASYTDPMWAVLRGLKSIYSYRHANKGSTA